MVNATCKARLEAVAGCLNASESVTKPVPVPTTLPLHCLTVRISVSQLGLAIHHGHIAALDENMLYHGLHVQGVATGHHDIRGFADVERA